MLEKEGYIIEEICDPLDEELEFNSREYSGPKPYCKSIEKLK